MRIAEGLEMLEISATIMGKPNIIYPTVIQDEKTVVLIDTGFPGQLPVFLNAFHHADISLQRIDKILITHQDIDHIGCLPDILLEVPYRPTVLAHEIEKPFIEGQTQLLKLTPENINKAVASLPDEVSKEMRQAFRAILEKPPSAHVDETISGGDELPYGGGIIVIETPGHTPGHISLYHKLSKTLIAGDAMVVEDGQLLGPPPAYCIDSHLALQSLKTLTQYDIEAVICYHGGLFTGDANERIANLASF